MTTATKTLPRKMFYKNASRYAVLATLVTFMGFLPSYFSKLGETDAAHHIHGITASTWMLLLIVQPWLYASNNLKWHRRVGMVTFIIVPLLVTSGLYMVHTMLNSADYPPGLPYQLAFIDFFTIAMFIFFYVMAIVHRKNLKLHARYMVATILGPLIPALARLFLQVPGIPSFAVSLHLSYAAIELVLIVLLIDDRRGGRFSKVYALALGLFVIQHVTMTMAADWGWWTAGMDWFASLG